MLQFHFQTKNISDEWAHQREQMEAHIAAMQQGEGALEKEMQQKVKECDEWRVKCSKMQTLLTDTEASLQEKNEVLVSMQVGINFVVVFYETLKVNAQRRVKHCLFSSNNFCGNERSWNRGS